MLRAVRPGQKLHLAGLSWKEGVVMGSRAALEGDVGEILAVWRSCREGSLRPVEWRPSGEGRYLCSWEVEERAMCDLVHRAAREAGSRLWTGDGKYYLPYRDQGAPYGYDWDGAVGREVCFFDPAGVRSKEVGPALEPAEVRALLLGWPVRAKERCGSGEMLAWVGERRWPQWKQYSRGLGLSGEWGVVEDGYLVRLCRANEEQKRALRRYRVECGEEMVLYFCAGSFGWGRKQGEIAVEDGYEWGLGSWLWPKGNPGFALLSRRGHREYGPVAMSVDLGRTLNPQQMALGGVKDVHGTEEVPPLRVPISWRSSDKEGQMSAAWWEQNARAEMADSFKGDVSGKIYETKEWSVVQSEKLSSIGEGIALERRGQTLLPLGLDTEPLGAEELGQILGNGQTLLLLPGEGTIRAALLEDWQRPEVTYAGRLSSIPWDTVEYPAYPWLKLRKVEWVAPPSFGKRWVPRPRVDPLKEVQDLEGRKRWEEAASGYERMGRWPEAGRCLRKWVEELEGARQYFQAGEVLEQRMYQPGEAHETYLKVSDEDREYARSRVCAWRCLRLVDGKRWQGEWTAEVKEWSERAAQFPWPEVRWGVEELVKYWMELAAAGQEEVQARIKRLCLGRWPRESPSYVRELSRRYFGDAGLWRKLTDVETPPDTGPEKGREIVITSADDRYQVSAEGVIVDTKIGLEWYAVSTPHNSQDYRAIVDTKIGLEWYVGPDRDTTWDEASAWVKSLAVDGGGWRMPTAKELRGIYEPTKSTTKDGYMHLDPVFDIGGWWVWSGELCDDNGNLSQDKNSPCARGFYFDSGLDFWRPRGLDRDSRGYAARSGRRG